MSGFSGVVSKSGFAPSSCEKFDTERCDLKIEEASYGSCHFSRFVSKKFLSDKLFIERNSIFYCTDGVLLNSNKLQKKYAKDNLEELFSFLYENNGMSFLKELRGNFSGFIHDRVTDRLYIFTNQLGSKPIYYFWDENRKMLFFGSRLKLVLDSMRENDNDAVLSLVGAYSLLSIGYIWDDLTLCEGVKKIPPGAIINVDLKRGSLEVESYYHFKFGPLDEDSEDRILENLDDLFAEAVKLEYEKDLEYGYRHLTTLSGGVDSRMALMKAELLGFDNQMIATFSQSGYIDEIIAKKIAVTHRREFLFYALDNGVFLKDIDRPIRHNEGMTTIPGLAHIMGLLTKIDAREYGLLHTGAIGEAIKGDYLSGREHKTVSMDFLRKRCNNLIEKIPSEAIDAILERYESEEMYLLHEQCINGTMANRYYDSVSPFLYLDFLEYSLRIPPHLRYGFNIYRKWIVNKMPTVDKYKWEKTSLRPSAGPLLSFMSLVIKNVRIKIQSGLNPRTSMNPFDYWYNNNPDLRDTMDSYFHEHLPLLKENPVLKQDVESLYASGGCMDKLKALTLLGAISYHDLDCAW